MEGFCRGARIMSLPCEHRFCNGCIRRRAPAAPAPPPTSLSGGRVPAKRRARHTLPGFRHGLGLSRFPAPALSCLRLRQPRQVAAHAHAMRMHCDADVDGTERSRCTAGGSATTPPARCAATSSRTRRRTWSSDARRAGRGPVAAQQRWDPPRRCCAARGPEGGAPAGRGPGAPPQRGHPPRRC